MSKTHRVLGIFSFALFFGCGSDQPPAEVRVTPGSLNEARDLAAYVDAFPVDSYTLVNTPVGKFYIDDNPALVKRNLLKGEVWEGHLIERFPQYVSPGDTVVDVGAHIGSITAPLAQLVGKAGRVYAYEPQRKIYRELVHNVRLNGLDNVVTLRFALGDRSGIVEMSPADQWDGRVRLGSGGERVELRTLDSFGLVGVALIKIDVEGHEFNVLRGAERTIHRSRPVMFIEVFKRNLRDVRQVLDDFGYDLTNILNDDYLALPRS